MLCTMEVQSSLIKEIRAVQGTNPQLDKIKTEVLVGRAPSFLIHEDGTLRFQNRVYVLVIEELKKKILDEGHNTPHFVHPSGNKLHKDLKRTIWRSNMK